MSVLLEPSLQERACEEAFFTREFLPENFSPATHPLAAAAAYYVLLLLLRIAPTNL
jgi:hypothetical protein